MDFEQAGVACRREYSVALHFSYLPKAPMGKVISFAVKTLPFMDISAYRSILTYAYIATERNPYTYGFSPTVLSQEGVTQKN